MRKGPVQARVVTVVETPGFTRGDDGCRLGVPARRR